MYMTALTKTFDSWIWPSCSMLNEWGSIHPERQCTDNQTNLTDILSIQYILYFLNISTIISE